MGSEPNLIHDFLGPPDSTPPNGISISSAVFAWLTIVTNRPSDHVITSVAIRCICVVLRCGFILLKGFNCTATKCILKKVHRTNNTKLSCYLISLNVHYQAYMISVTLYVSNHLKLVCTKNSRLLKLLLHSFSGTAETGITHT